MHIVQYPVLKPSPGPTIFHNVAGQGGGGRSLLSIGSYGI